MEKGMVVCEGCGGHGEVRSARFTPEAVCDLEACPACHGRGVVRGEQLTPALVREGIAAVVEAAAEEDFEAAHAEEDKLRARVLRAIAGGRCDDPETCARLALSTSVVAFTRHCA